MKTTVVSRNEKGDEKTYDYSHITENTVTPLG